MVVVGGDGRIQHSYIINIIFVFCCLLPFENTAMEKYEVKYSASVKSCASVRSCASHLRGRHEEAPVPGFL